MTRPYVNTFSSDPAKTFEGQRKKTLKVHPRGDLRAPLAGVFATRSPDRPNPLGLHNEGRVGETRLDVRVTLCVYLKNPHAEFEQDVGEDALHSVAEFSVAAFSRQGIKERLYFELSVSGTQVSALPLLRSL